MGTSNSAYAVNDNRPVDGHSLEDRMGFHAFLKQVKSQQNSPKYSLSGVLKNSIKPKKDTAISSTFRYVGFIALALSLCLSSLLVLYAVSSIQKLLALSLMTVTSLIFVAVAEKRKSHILHNLSLLVAILSAIGALYIVGDSFAVSALTIKAGGLWIMAASLSLVSACIFKSRMALILSISISAAWGYCHLTTGASLTLNLLALPILAALQVGLSQYLRDGLSQFASQLMFYTWIGIALYTSFSEGVLSLPMMVSLTTLLSGILYIATTQPLSLQRKHRSLGTGIGSWAVLIACAFGSILLWISPNKFDAVFTPTPLAQFGWQMGLICGVSFILFAALIRRSKYSHSLSRRLLGALSISLLAISHYAQSDLEFLSRSYGLEALPLYAGLACLGVLTVLTLSKLISAIRYSAAAWLILSSLSVIFIGLSIRLIPVWNADLVAVTIIAALMTLCVLVWTHKIERVASSVYRPLKRAKNTQTQKLADVPMENPTRQENKALYT